MSDWKIIYSHGRGGHPWNDSRTIAIKEIADQKSIEMLSITYDENQTVKQMTVEAFEFCNQANSPANKLILIGSSRGAYILSAVTQMLFETTGKTTAGLYLMAPAIDIKPDYYPGPMRRPNATNIEVVHPYRDEVVPVANTINYCAKNDITLHLVDSTHTLQNQVKFIASSTRLLIENCLENPIAAVTNI